MFQRHRIKVIYSVMKIKKMFYFTLKELVFQKIKKCVLQICEVLMFLEN